MLTVVPLKTLNNTLEVVIYHNEDKTLTIDMDSHLYSAFYTVIAKAYELGKLDMKVEVMKARLN